MLGEFLKKQIWYCSEVILRFWTCFGRAVGSKQVHHLETCAHTCAHAHAPVCTCKSALDSTSCRCLQGAHDQPDSDLAVASRGEAKPRSVVLVICACKNICLLGSIQRLEHLHKMATNDSLLVIV